jgi:DNA-binding SARP family transcriptional activator
VLPDLAELSSILAVLGVLALGLHKRDWRSIPSRFRETRSGQRHYLFGPPDRTGALSSDPRVRTLQRLRAELRCGFELGIPLLAAAWYAEIRGIEARRRQEAGWRQSKKGLLLRHVAGDLSEEELHARLRQRGHLLPAPELVLPQLRTMPPMRWRLEWDQRLKEMEAEADRRWADDATATPPVAAGPPPAPAPAAVVPTAAPGPPAAVQGPVITPNAPVAGDTAAASDATAAVDQSESRIDVHTLGEIRLVIEGEDVAPELMHAPALAFTVLYLLAWDVRQPGDRVTRESFGEETFQGQDPQARRRGVSQRLANLKRGFPRLRSRIRTEGEYLSFDSAGCDIDVRWVLRIAEQVKAAGGSLAGEMYEDAQTALALAAREFLSGWDGIESRGTLGGSAAAEVVAEVRDRVVAARLDILGALSDAALARQQLDDAISYLEEALRLRPERTALARKLADVCERNGHPQRASRLRGEYGLDEAS